MKMDSDLRAESPHEALRTESCSPNSYVEALIPNMTVFGNKTECGHREELSSDRTSVLIRREREIRTLCPARTQREGGTYSQEEALTREPIRPAP